MSKFFGSVNEVDSHNKSRHSDIGMDKFRVGKCGCLRLCNTVAIWTTINNCWKLFCYQVKMYHYEKFIGIRKFSERLDMDCFSTPFTIEIGQGSPILLDDTKMEIGEMIFNIRGEYPFLSL